MIGHPSRATTPAGHHMISLQQWPIQLANGPGPWTPLKTKASCPRSADKWPAARPRPGSWRAGGGDGPGACTLSHRRPRGRDIRGGGASHPRSQTQSEPPPPSAAPLDSPRWAGLGLGGGGNPSPAPSGSRRGGYRPVGPGVPLADGLNTRIHTVSISINRVIIPYLYLSNISKRYMNHRLRHGEPLAPFRRNEVCCGRDRAPVGHREGPRALGVLMPARGGGSLFCTY